MVGVLRTLMAQAQIDPEFGARFQEGFLQRRRAALETLVTRAAERGDLPAGRSPATTSRVVFGVIWYEILAGDPARSSGRESELIAELVSLLT